MGELLVRLIFSKDCAQECAEVVQHTAVQHHAHVDPEFDVKPASSADHHDKKAPVSGAWQVLNVMLDLSSSRMQLPLQDSFCSVSI